MGMVPPVAGHYKDISSLSLRHRQNHASLQESVEHVMDTLRCCAVSYQFVLWASMMAGAGISYWTQGVHQ
jgi:hypothetical protein